MVNKRKFIISDDLFSGFEADIVGVEGNPLEDITILEDISFVMKDGVIFKQ